MAYQTPLTVSDVIKDISNNKYVLPSIQREYVWKSEQIECLFDSLMQDYPIGAFLFWEISKEKYKAYDFYYFLKDYHERKSIHNPKANLTGEDSVIAVLDGQQRLTSLYIGLKGTYAEKIPRKRKENPDAYPKKKLYLNIVEPADYGNNKYNFRFLAESEIKNNSQEYWFEVGKILEMKELGDVTEFLMDNITYSELYDKEQGKFANRALSQLFKVFYTQPNICYYKEKSEELDKVLNIFVRVNSGGTVLSYSDLLLSIASAQWEKLDAREEIIELVDQINDIGRGFKVNKDFVLKASLVLSDFTDIAFKVDNFNKPNMLKIESNWSVIKKSLMQAYNLISSLGYSGETLSSNNAIIPIAYYLKEIGFPSNFEVSSATKQNRMKIKKWLILSLLKKVFSGTPDNIIRQIRAIIKENGKEEFPLRKIVDYFKGKNKSIIFTDDDVDEYLLKLKYGKSETLSTLMLLYPSLDFNNKFHIDHMYPKSVFNKKELNKRGIVDGQEVQKYMDNVNSIGNLQLLAAIPNIEKQAKDFDEWFNENYISDLEKMEYRKIHYMPDMDYTYKNFLKFVEKREELLRIQLKKILIISEEIN